MFFVVYRLSYESEFLHFLRLLEATIRLHVLSAEDEIDQCGFMFLYIYMLYIYTIIYILHVQLN